MHSTTRFFPTRPAQPLRSAHGEHAGPARSADANGALRTPAHKRGLLTATALCALCCLSLAGCDGGSSGSSASGSGAGGTAAAANNAPAGAGGASAPVAIVAAPASGGCAALGASAVQPLQNTQLVCAP